MKSMGRESRVSSLSARAHHATDGIVSKMKRRIEIIRTHVMGDEQLCRGALERRRSEEGKCKRGVGVGGQAWLTAMLARDDQEEVHRGHGSSGRPG